MRAHTIAVIEGGGVRVGLEDNLWFDSGQTRLATNAMLLERVHELAAYFERPPMTPAEFRGLGFSNRQRNTTAGSSGRCGDRP